MNNQKHSNIVWGAVFVFDNARLIFKGDMKECALLVFDKSRAIAISCTCARPISDDLNVSHADFDITTEQTS